MPGRGVVVLGMHRGGTSAIAGLLRLAGLRMPVDPSLTGSSRNNPKGFWEIRPLTHFNESLLRAFDGDWSAPPPLDEGWVDDPRAASLKDRAARLFNSIIPSEAWLWKDPRLCLTMPFWRDAGAKDAVSVLVLRNPLEVARSLQRRNSFSGPLSLALWETYMTGALRSAAGGPVAVVEYQSVVEDPVGSSRSLRSWLVDHGVRCDPIADDEELAGSIDPSLRHTSFTSEDFGRDPLVSRQQLELQSGLASVVGYHASFEPPELSGLTPWAEALISERSVARRLMPRRTWRHKARSKAARWVRARKGA